MNINPHVQYMQQAQQGPQAQTINPSIKSPLLSQLQIQQQYLQQQRQQLLNQHLQQQQLQLQQQTQQQLQQQAILLTPGASNVSMVNPVIASANGQVPQQTGGHMNAGVNHALHLHLQQLRQQQQQRQQQQLLQQQILSQQSALPQQQQLQSQPPLPVMKEVWAHNLNYEFTLLRSHINDSSATVYITTHQEIPGIVARPVGIFRSASDYHFQTLKTNSDLLDVIQLSICVVKVKNNEIGSSIIWQFNFAYDLSKEMYNREHLSILFQSAQINSQMHALQGIQHFDFAELFIESGLLMNESINWISFHAGYDLGFFVSLLKNDILPFDEKEFYWWCAKYFPNYYDLKQLGNHILNPSVQSGAGGKSLNGNPIHNNPTTKDTPSLSTAAGDFGLNTSANTKPSIEYLAEDLSLLPLPPALLHHFASSSSQGGQPNLQITSALHVYLSMECFQELLRRCGSNMNLISKYKGLIWGLRNIYGDVNYEADEGSHGLNPDPTTPKNTSKGGFVHYSRPF